MWSWFDPTLSPTSSFRGKVMKNRNWALVVAGSLALIGLLGTLMQAITLYIQKEDRLGLILWVVIWGCGLLAVWKPFKMIFHILNK
jgi:uncharacterized membrane-anchored protein